MLNFFIMKHCDGTRNTRVVYLFIPASETAVCPLYLHFSSFFTNRRLILFGSLCVHHKTNTQTESQLEMVLIPFLRITWGWVTGWGFWEIPLKTLWLMTPLSSSFCAVCSPSSCLEAGTMLPVTATQTPEEESPRKVQKTFLGHSWTPGPSSRTPLWSSEVGNQLH